MSVVKGPGIFIAQYAGDTPPFNDLKSISRWAASLGYKGLQIPTWDNRFIDTSIAAKSKDYCDEIKGVVAAEGLEITELSAHMQGHLIATHPTYDRLFDFYTPPAFHRDTTMRRAYAVEQLKLAAKSSQNLGLSVVASFSGSLAWPFFYGFPQLPAGLFDEAFKELASRWRPILDYYDDCGVDVAYEIHAGEDLHDGVTFERFLDEVDQHPRANILYDPSHFVIQQIDYLAFLDHYHSRVKACHIKDAEYRRNGKSGVYGGYQKWVDRAGRFRSPGDGQIDFGAIFSKLAEYNYQGWAVLEWECVVKDSLESAREGAPFIRNHIIKTSTKAFDDFAASGIDPSENRSILGLS